MPNFSELKHNVRGAFPKLKDATFEESWVKVESALQVAEFDMDIKEAEAKWGEIKWEDLDIHKQFLARIREEIENVLHGTPIVCVVSRRVVGSKSQRVQS